MATKKTETRGAKPKQLGAAWFLGLPQGSAHYFDLAEQASTFHSNLLVAAKRKGVIIETESVRGWGKSDPVELLKATIL